MTTVKLPYDVRDWVLVREAQGAFGWERIYREIPERPLVPCPEIEFADVIEYRNEVYVVTHAHRRGFSARSMTDGLRTFGNTKFIEFSLHRNGKLIWWHGKREGDTAE